MFEACSLSVGGMCSEQAYMDFMYRVAPGIYGIEGDSGMLVTAEPEGGGVSSRE